MAKSPALSPARRRVYERIDAKMRQETLHTRFLKRQEELRDRALRRWVGQPLARPAVEVPHAIEEERKQNVSEAQGQSSRKSGSAASEDVRTGEVAFTTSHCSGGSDTGAEEDVVID